MSSPAQRRDDHFLRRWLWRSPIVPGLVIAALVGFALLSDNPTSGIAVTMRLGNAPYRGYLTVTPRGHREVLTGHRAGRTGRFELRLSPGTYVLHPKTDRGTAMPVARQLVVRVRDRQFTSVTIVYRPLRRGRGSG